MNSYDLAKEMGEMKLSVIICVYNTDPAYVDECIGSVRRSSLSDYEIIFVDDGSTVDYSATVEKYAVRYSKTENRGLFGARLHGISLAEGDYIAFVDSDDTVSKNYHLPMLHAAERTDADIVLNDWAFNPGRIRHYCTKDSTIAKNIDISGDALAFYTSQRGREHSYFVQWNKLFRRELLIRVAADIAKTEAKDKHIVYAEDALMNFFSFKNATRVVGIHSGFYFYRIHGEQSVVAGSEARLRSQIELMSFALDEMDRGVDGRESADKIREDINEWRALMSRAHFDAARRAGFTSLYGLIIEAYGVEKLTRPLPNDSSAYKSTEIIGRNFDVIDERLTELWLSGDEAVIAPSDGTKYIDRFIGFYERATDGRIRRGGGGVKLPKNGVPIKQRIIYNRFIYSIGSILFKKGSRLRGFLKKLAGAR